MIYTPFVKLCKHAEAKLTGPHLRIQIQVIPGVKLIYLHHNYFTNRKPKIPWISYLGYSLQNIQVFLVSMLCKTLLFLFKLH